MEFSHSLIGSVALKSAIDSDPLLVAPNTPLLEVIAQMSQAKGNVCDLLQISHKDHQSDAQGGTSPSEPHQFMTDGSGSSQQTPVSRSPRQTSCVLIVDRDASISLKQQQVIGIFTERDIVKLVAKGGALDDLSIGEVMISPVISLAESEFKDIFAPLFLFRRYKIRHLLIVDDCDRPIGIVSPASIRTILRPANLLKLRRVSDIMARNVVCADYHTGVLHAAQLMTKHRVSCVVITEHNDDRGVLPIGIVTERDIVQFRTLELDLSIQVGTVMSSPLCLLNPDDSLWTAHQEMQRLRVRRLVVSWNWGKGLGIVTQTSLLRVFDPLEMYGVLETLQSTIQQLHSEKRLPAAFSHSPILDADSTPQLSLAQTSSALSALPTEHPTPNTPTRQKDSLTPVSHDVYAWVEHLSQRLKLMETTLVELSCTEGDRPKKQALHTDLRQALHATQCLEKLLQPPLESTTGILRRDSGAFRTPESR